jgi:hypothetical protein
MQQKTLFCAAGLALILAATAASADNTVRLRGTIDHLEGPNYVIKARDGTQQKLVLADNAQVVALVKSSLSDIKQGSFVGVTAMPQTDGSQRAVEVHIFPEAMRGTGEGHRPWDLMPKSTMTNANVEQAVTGVDGQTLTLRYKDGEKKIVVPGEAPIVTFVPGDKNELKPGVKVFVPAATREPDGSLQAARINYGKGGVNPPM